MDSLSPRLHPLNELSLPSDFQDMVALPGIKRVIIF